MVPKERDQTKIDSPDSSAINHLSSAPIDIQSDQRFKSQIFNKYLECSDGKIGLMKGVVSITHKDDARPYQASIRRVAQAMEMPLKDELDRFVHEGILVKMDPDKPSDWLNSFICVRKPNGKIRLCLVPAQLNKDMVMPKHNA